MVTRPQLVATIEIESEGPYNLLEGSMTEFDRQMELARDQIVKSLGSLSADAIAPRPSELLRRVASNRDRGPYRAALLTLIRDGRVVAAEDWRLTLRASPAVS